MAEKTDASAKGNDPNPEKGGVDAVALLEKVGKLLKDEAGFDLDEYLSTRDAETARKTAEDAGKQAQKTYDPKLSKLENELKRLGQENLETKRQLRETRIANMPEAAREAARRLAEAEDANDEVKDRSWRANEALKIARAKELALDLRERGIKDYTYQDFLEFDSPEEMAAKHAEIRADVAEKRLAEKETGSGKPEPPASSNTPSRGKGGASGAGGAAGSTRSSGDKPWAEQKGKGLDERNLTEALRRMQEEDYRGD